MNQPQVVLSTPIAETADADLPHTALEMQPAELPVVDGLGLTMTEVHAAADAGINWLWQGYLAPGNVTLLTSQWKTGKTTLIAILLARLLEGGSLCGQALARGRAVVVSEEGNTHWSLRGRKLGIGDNVRFICRPFRGKPRVDEWQGLIDRLTEATRGNLSICW